MNDSSEPAVLIVFVDALPFDDLALAPEWAAWTYRARLRPGFGYSINLHAELFAGLTPDQAGFFGEWAPDESRAPGRRYRRALPALDRVFRPYVLNRGLQTVLTRRYRPDRIMPNLPLARLGDFAILGEKVQDGRFPAPTLFTRFPQLEQVADAAMAKGRRDRANVALAAGRVQDGARALYVPLPDLDGIGHVNRRASGAWREHVEWLAFAIDDLATDFLSRYPAGDVLVVSDHGMADVSAGVRFDASSLGRQGADTFLLFTDSTLLRLWVRDPGLLSAAQSAIELSAGTNLVTDPERSEFGLTSPQFGTFVAVLDEGLCYEPSTFARHIPAAMHGYHPDVASQHAVLLHRGAHPPGPAARTIDVYRILAAAVSRTAGVG